jgi:hypothetical protein
MNIVKRLDQYDNNCIFFCDPIKNNIMSDGNFIRILYSTHIVTFNGIYLLIKFNDVIYDKYYSKYKCSFNYIEHIEIIERIKEIEESILSKLDMINKSKQYKIFEQLKNGHFKIFCDKTPKFNNLFILKISGIWETNSSYGLTFKFINT